MNPLAAEGPAIAFIGLAVFTLLVGTMRNVAWGILVLWLAAFGVWLGVSAAIGWVLLVSALVGACLMPSRSRKAQPEPPAAPVAAEVLPPPPPAPSYDDLVRKVPKPDGPMSAWEQITARADP